MKVRGASGKKSGPRRTARVISLVAVCALAAEAACAQQAGAPDALVSAGQITVNGHAVPYRIRHLPVSSFPALPPAVSAVLTAKNCLIPQTYEARQPENVVHGSFEKAGSQDWAALCSAGGRVSLMVFFASALDKPVMLSSLPETARLQPRDLSGSLGFAWAIDVATPEQIHDKQIGMTPRPPRLDHDALADSDLRPDTVYRYFSNRTWTRVDTAE